MANFKFKLFFQIMEVLVLDYVHLLFMISRKYSPYTFNTLAPYYNCRIAAFIVEQVVSGNGH